MWYIAPISVRDLNFMLETQLSLYWRLCWSLVCPLLLPLLFFYVLFTQSGVPAIPVPAQLCYMTETRHVFSPSIPSHCTVENQVYITMH